MRTVAVVQARMGSTRLPGKVLRPLGSRTVLGQVLARLARAPGIDRVVVATTAAASDDPVVAEAERNGATVVRGSEEDVLSRYALAARESGADVVVRVTSDCPLLDGGLVGTLVAAFHAARAAGRPLDYLSNTVVRSYPRGLDAEVFTRTALERAHAEARTPSQREHVTPFFYQNPALFMLEQYVRMPDLSALRWTLDTPEDWDLLSRLFEAIEKRGEVFGTAAVLAVLERHPEWSALNAGVRQKPVL
ncbi:MAG TPA: glycosyltransferase family protein [Elusimicrobiota bacterium]|nr:glycosyltransferase family protein [Elusimicrobiota bacterium]